jgi:hypothetical protein
MFENFIKEVKRKPFFYSYPNGYLFLVWGGEQFMGKKALQKKLFRSLGFLKFFRLCKYFKVFEEYFLGFVEYSLGIEEYFVGFKEYSFGFEMEFFWVSERVALFL